MKYVSNADTNIACKYTSLLLIGYQADIICVQEMDKRHFLNYYQPFMEDRGYQSSMLMKQQQKIPKCLEELRGCGSAESGTSHTRLTCKRVTQSSKWFILVSKAYWNICYRNWLHSGRNQCFMMDNHVMSKKIRWLFRYFACCRCCFFHVVDSNRLQFRDINMAPCNACCTYSKEPTCLTLHEQSCVGWPNSQTTAYQVQLYQLFNQSDQTLI